MANPTNPNRVVRVKDLDRFKGKCDQRYAQSATSIITVADITTLTTAQLDGLAIGDMVVKSDSTGKHSYHVTYKSATGCCLTYYDAENIETVAYEKENDEWGYLDTTYARVSNIPNKADKVSGSNLNNKIALLNSNGNLKSSGVTVDDLTTTYATTATCEAIIDEVFTDVVTTTEEETEEASTESNNSEESTE